MFLGFQGLPEGSEIAPKSTPRRVQNRPVGGPNWASELFCASWAQLGRQGRSEAVFGRPGGACDALRAVLGASSGVPGRSWAPLEGHFGTPQGLI